MKISLQAKMLSLMIFLAGISFIGILLFKYSEDDKISLLLNNQKNEQQQSLTKAFTLAGKSLSMQAYDYSIWNDMVNFVYHPDYEWAKYNIDNGMTTFHSDFIWIYDEKLELKYFTTTLDSSFNKNIFNGKLFLEFLKKKPFPHFFINTSVGLLDVYGAPIQPENDLQRISIPNGYFLVARIFTHEYINELSELCDGTVEIILEGKPGRIKNQNEKFSITTSSVVENWNDVPSATFQLKRKSTLAEILYKMLNKQYLLIGAIHVLIFLTFSLLIYFFVNHPIGIISKSLFRQDVTLLKKLKNKRDEFGQLAFLINQFFKQKNELAMEITERKQAEEMLLKFQKDLENLVAKRTKELEITNTKLEEDIAERKKTELELKKSNENFMKLFYTSPEAIFLIRTRDEVFVDVNFGFTQLIGYSADELKGKSYQSISACIGYYELSRLFTQLKQIGSAVGLEIIFRTKDGNSGVGLVSASIVEYDNQETAIIIIRDITYRVKIEEELIKAKQKAESSEKLKSEFLAQMSHEIRSPINAILSFSNLLKSELEPIVQEELKVSFSAISNAGARIIRTVDLILNMSELQTGAYEPHFRNVYLFKDILDRSLQEFNSVAKQKNLDLYFLNGTDLSDIKVWADDYTLGQIFNNLISNAIKYTDTGSVIIKTSYASTTEILVEVIDTGIGISEEYLPKIFEPFSQEEQGYTRRYEGNGLGLALVKKYCDINNFRIMVNSTKYKGSTFSLYFPYNL